MQSDVPRCGPMWTDAVIRPTHIGYGVIRHMAVVCPTSPLPTRQPLSD